MLHASYVSTYIATPKEMQSNRNSSCRGADNVKIVSSLCSIPQLSTHCNVSSSRLKQNYRYMYLHSYCMNKPC